MLAPPLAWVVAGRGYGMAAVDPVGDLSSLALWSVAEEVVFRGLLQRALLHYRSLAPRAPAGTLRTLAGISMANAIASLLFAAAHLWAHPPLAALGVLPVSLVLGAAFERSGERLAAPAALHVYFNFALYGCSFVLARA